MPDGTQSKLETAIKNQLSVWTYCLVQKLP